jgi:hypothetical protein
LPFAFREQSRGHASLRRNPGRTGHKMEESSPVHWFFPPIESVHEL